MALAVIQLYHVSVSYTEYVSGAQTNNEACSSGSAFVRLVTAQQAAEEWLAEVKVSRWNNQPV